jgi:hypothetical protein
MPMEVKPLPIGFHVVPPSSVRNAPEMPDTGELPRMRRAVVPLMGARRAVVHEAVAHRLPGETAAVGATLSHHHPTGPERASLSRFSISRITLTGRRRERMNVSQVAFAQRFGVRFDIVRSVGAPAGDRTRSRSGRARLRAARCRVKTEPQATHNKSARAGPQKRTEYFRMYQAHRRAEAARGGRCIESTTQPRRR